MIYRNGRKNSKRIAPQQSINSNIDRVTLINTANQQSMLRINTDTVYLPCNNL